MLVYQNRLTKGQSQLRETRSPGWGLVSETEEGQTVETSVWTTSRPPNPDNSPLLQRAHVMPHALVADGTVSIVSSSSQSPVRIWMNAAHLHQRFSLARRFHSTVRRVSSLPQYGDMLQQQAAVRKA